MTISVRIIMSRLTAVSLCEAQANMEAGHGVVVVRKVGHELIVTMDLGHELVVKIVVTYEGVHMGIAVVDIVHVNKKP